MVMFRAWVLGRDDIVGIALMGSWARRGARPDSDVDLVLVVSDPARSIGDLSWIATDLV
jgi:predicted nucleotidyltransferase